jgi:hypothetical protein
MEDGRTFEEQGVRTGKATWEWKFGEPAAQYQVGDYATATRKHPGLVNWPYQQTNQFWGWSTASMFEPRTRVVVVKDRSTIKEIVRNGIDRQDASNQKETGATKCRRVNREKLWSSRMQDGNQVNTLTFSDSLTCRLLTHSVKILILAGG